MTLPVVPGNPMSFSQINTELGFASTTLISLNQASVRTLAGVGASPATIAITNLSGKSNSFTFTISTNQTNANLRTLAVNAGWAGTAKVVATINSGIFVYSTSTGTPALTIDGSFPNGVALVNGGTIQGQGGDAGRGGNYNTNGSGGSSGGLALSVAVAVTITNNNRIAGGGGGGGGGGGAEYVSGKSVFYKGGSGGGGGLGGNGGAAGARGSGAPSPAGDGLAGAAGTQTTAGNGGSAVGQAGAGGAGGSYGSTGSTGSSGSGTYLRTGGSGGAAGGAITGNTNITWLVLGTRNGGIS